MVTLDPHKRKFDTNPDSDLYSRSCVVLKIQFESEEENMPTVAFLVSWKRNRNHRGRDIVFSSQKAMNMADEKKCLGFKASVKKLSPNDPLVLHYQRYGIMPLS